LIIYYYKWLSWSLVNGIFNVMTLVRHKCLYKITKQTLTSKLPVDLENPRIIHSDLTGLHTFLLVDFVNTLLMF